MSGTASKSIFTLSMNKGKETKGTVVYTAPQDAQITSVYIAKSAFPDGNFPAQITVTVS